MYKGIGPEAGKQVRETDAFSYACEQCLIGTKEEQDTFLELAKRHTDFWTLRKSLWNGFIPVTGSMIHLEDRKPGGSSVWKINRFGVFMVHIWKRSGAQGKKQKKKAAVL